MSTLSTIVFLLAQAAGWLSAIALSLLGIAAIIWPAIWAYANYTEKLLARLELQARRNLGADIVRCSLWVRSGDDAALIIKAVGNLLRNDCGLDGGQLKAEYSALKTEAK